MAKRAPEERWKEHIREKWSLFRNSKELYYLRRLGFKALRRRRLLTSPEWWNASQEGLMSGDAYRTFQEECRRIGAEYGLSQWGVEFTCLLKGYSPDKEPHVLEAQWPNVEVVTEATEPLFLRWLMFVAWKRGLYVTQRQGSVEVKLLAMPFPDRPETPLQEDARPPRDVSFSIRVDLPPDYPPEAGAELARRSARVSRSLLKDLGYPMRQRMRSPRSSSFASKLRLDKKRLDPNEAGDIAEEIYGEGAAKDPVLRKRVRDLRSRWRRDLRGER